MNSNTDFQKIAELDLDPIKVKLMHKQSGEGWSLQQANAVELEYRRFLYLMKLFPHEEMAPLFDVDIFWHYHILDTMKYAADCEHIFGYFLHHFPYVGMGGEDDEVAHHRVGERMQELYEATFGEAYIRQDEGTAARGIAAWSSQAQNDRVYAVRPSLEMAAIAWCSQTQSANDACYAVRPALEAALTAWCSQVHSANDSSYSVRPVLAAVTAWCPQTQSANDSACALRPAATGITAWCSQVQGANGSAGSGRPTFGTAITAWCSQVQSANDSCYAVRPALAQAA